MTNSITATATQNTQDFLVTANLIETVAYYLKKIQKSHRQLILIERTTRSEEVSLQAEAYLKKQNKLIAIAEELKSRMITHVGQIGNITKEQNKEMEKQFAQEVDILNYMHFEVTKTYFSFINNNFEARVISLRRPMAA